MVNAAPFLALYHEFLHLLAASCGAILGAAAGLPVKRRIVPRWAVRRG